MNRLRLSYKTIIVNYIGGIGYYSFLVAFILWLASLISKMQHFLVSPGVRQLSDTPPPDIAYQIGTGSSNGALVVFSYVLILLVVILVGALPYYIGKSLSKGVRKVLYMTGKSATIKSIYGTKLLINTIFVGVVIVTCYDFTSTATDNIYTVLIMALCLFSIVTFFVQNVVAHLWKTNVDSIY